MTNGKIANHSNRSPDPGTVEPNKMNVGTQLSGVDASATIFRNMEFSSDIRGYESPSDLIKRIDAVSPEFPYERELCLYLLMHASLWKPDELFQEDSQSSIIVDAARVFAGAINHLVRTIKPNANVRLYQDEFIVFSQYLDAEQVEQFNKLFYSRIGGPESAIVTPSVQEHHRRLALKIGATLIAHDVVDYLIRTAQHYPELNSLRSAYIAIQENIFERPSGYLIPRAEKRKGAAQKQGRASPAAVTAATVESHIKKAPDTLLLSFVLVRRFNLAEHPINSTQAFMRIADNVESPSWRSFAVVAHLLRAGAKKLNRRFERMATLIPEVGLGPVRTPTLEGAAFERVKKAVAASRQGGRSA